MASYYEIQPRETHWWEPRGGERASCPQCGVHSVVSAVWQPVQLCSIPQPLPGFPAPASPHPVDTSASSGPLAPTGHLLPEVLVPAVQCFHSDGACLPQMIQVSATCVLPLVPDPISLYLSGSLVGGRALWLYNPGPFRAPPLSGPTS